MSKFRLFPFSFGKAGVFGWLGANTHSRKTATARAKITTIAAAVAVVVEP